MPREGIRGRTAGGLDVLAARVGERDELASRVRGDGDEALVLELADRGVDGARAGRPSPPAALGDRLHQLVAVHRLLGEEQQDGSTDVATRRPSVAAATVAGRSVVGRPRVVPAGMVVAVAGMRALAL